MVILNHKLTYFLGWHPCEYP